MEVKLNKAASSLVFLAIMCSLVLAACGEEDRSPAPVIVITRAPAPTASPSPTIQPLQSLPTLVFLTPTPTVYFSPTPQPTPTYRPTSTPEIRPLPSPPAFATSKPEQLAKSVADWLNKLPGALPGTGTENARQFLRDLLLTWGATGVKSPVEAADLDGDNLPELVATVAESWSDLPTIKRDAGFLLVLKGTRSGWSPNILRSRTLNATVEEDFLHPEIVKIADLNNDKIPEIVLSELVCGSNTCNTRLHVLNFTGGKFVGLTPQPPAMPTATIGFEVITPDGQSALTLTGGVINSPTAGLQRARTEYWRWDSTARIFKLSETRTAVSFFLYHRVLDANSALDKGDYALAIELYNGAVNDSSLKLWFAEVKGTSEEIQKERETLVAFARFRMGIANALSNNRARALFLFQEAQTKDGKYSGWATAFNLAYETSKGTNAVAVKEGCEAIVKFSQQNSNLLEGLNKFGPNNPVFSSENMCPVLK
jgi:hypothetical protein